MTRTFSSSSTLILIFWEKSNFWPKGRQNKIFQNSYLWPMHQQKPLWVIIYRKLTSAHYVSPSLFRKLVNNMLKWCLFLGFFSKRKEMLKYFLKYFISGGFLKIASKCYPKPHLLCPREHFFYEELHPKSTQLYLFREYVYTHTIFQVDKGLSCFHPF